MKNLPFVTIVIPCRNEEKFIGKCLDSIIANDYPKDRIEALVIDGMSQDRTREIIKGYASRYPFIKLLDNPKKITPAALNTGIRNTKGEIIMRMDAHATYETDYIKKCVLASQKYSADNVVGIWKILPRGKGFIDKAIVSALSSSFGVGNAKYRTGSCKQPEWVDTGAYGCYKKDIFKKIGQFNEKLIHSQDMEFNLRLKRAGGKTLLVPDAVVYYYARTDFISFCKYNFRNGVWAILPFKYTSIMPVLWRHLVPLVFVSSLIGSAILSFFSPIFLYLLLLISTPYLLISIFFSCKIASKEKNLRYLFLMPVIYASLHISYGLGSLIGLIRASFSKKFWMNLRAISAGKNNV